MTNTAKKWTIALAISVGLNVFLLGTLAAGWHRGPRPPHGPEHGPTPDAPPHHARPERGALRDKQSESQEDLHLARTAAGAEGRVFLREMVQTLGGPSDPRVKKVWGDQREDMKKFRDDVRGAREDVRKALSAEPFDDKELERALGALHKITTDAQARSQEAVLELARELTPEERQRLTERKDYHGGARSNPSFPGARGPRKDAGAEAPSPKP